MQAPVAGVATIVLFDDTMTWPMPYAARKFMPTSIQGRTSFSTHATAQCGELSRIFQCTSLSFRDTQTDAVTDKGI